MIIILFFYIFAFFIVANIFYRSIRCSEFGVLLSASDFLFFGLGLCLYPISFIIYLLSLDKTAESFTKINDALGMVVSLHALSYCIFASFGYYFATRRKYSANSYLFKRIRLGLNDPYKLFVFLLVLERCFMVFSFILLVWMPL